MAQEIISKCPVCNHRLIATKLSCKSCGLELSNDFTLSKFNYLNTDELEFIEVYLHCKGNLKELQKEMKLSYPAAKKRFDTILSSLGYQPENSLQTNMEIVLSEVPIYEDESAVVKSIKQKLNETNGITRISLPRGSDFQICYEPFGNGLHATNIPSSRILTWSAFDAAIELLKKQNGKAQKGQAMKAKLGEAGLTLDTIEGYVAYKAYGVKKGESTLRMISALSAILEWCGMCKNGYGYLTLKS